jgi:Methyltransferase domain
MRVSKLNRILFIVAHSIVASSKIISREKSLPTKPGAVFHSNEYVNLDLSRISHITQSTAQQMNNTTYLEELIVRLGFNSENLREQPDVVKNNAGGLFIWQYPNQFAQYLTLIYTLNISSYIEIGCRWGGTFILTTEYIKKTGHLHTSVAVDVFDSPVSSYCSLITQPEAQFLKLDSHSKVFQDYISSNSFDLIFIDGDHSYEGVRSDYEVCRNSGKIFVFHDISNSVCPGVVRFWKELKEKEKNKYDFFEFIEQYDEVTRATQQHFLGIGVAVTRNT